MASEYWFGAEGTLTITAPDDSTDIPAAGIRGITITPTAEHVELYTADSILWEAVKRRQAAVDIELEYLKWNKDLVEWYLGDGTAVAQSFNDTSDVGFFEIETTITNEGGGDTIKAVLSDVHFPDGIPLFDFQEGEWLARSVSARAKDIDTTDPV